MHFLILVTRPQSWLRTVLCRAGTAYSFVYVRRIAGDDDSGWAVYDWREDRRGQGGMRVRGAGAGRRVRLGRRRGEGRARRDAGGGVPGALEAPKCACVCVCVWWRACTRAHPPPCRVRACVRACVRSCVQIIPLLASSVDASTRPPTCYLVMPRCSGAVLDAAAAAAAAAADAGAAADVYVAFARVAGAALMRAVAAAHAAGVTHNDVKPDVRARRELGLVCVNVCHGILLVPTRCALLDRAAGGGGFCGGGGGGGAFAASAAAVEPCAAPSMQPRQCVAYSTAITSSACFLFVCLM